MIKTFAMTLASCLLCFFCFAQAPLSGNRIPASHEQPVTKAEKGMFLEGTVESVSVADVHKKTKSEITVTDAAGIKESFLVKATTTIYDSASGPANLDSIKSGDKVKIKYFTTKEGIKEAVSIARLK